MLEIYAKTFMIATCTDRPAMAGVRSGEPVRAGARPGWLAETWRRLLARGA